MQAALTRAQPVIYLLHHRLARTSAESWFAFLSVFVAVGAGLAVSTGGLLYTLALPPLAVWQSTRLRCALVAFSYFASCSHAILQVGPYLETLSASLPAVCYWIAAAFIQAFLWVVAWGREQRPTRITLALFLSVIPPLGFVSWAHPLHAAGLLFPGTGLLGILLTTLLLELIAWEPLAAAFILVFALSPEPTNLRPSDWEGFHTAFGDVFRTGNALDVMDAVNRELETNPAAIQVWPESVLPHWNEATELFWSSTLASARSKGKTVILGSTISIPDARLTRLRNVAVIRGREDALPVDQRTPVPGGTWHPFSGSGVPLGFDSPIRSVHGQRAAFLVCYEQLLAWSYLSLLHDRPTILVGLANVYWVESTSLPSVQTAALKSWARLMNIPYVEAVNR